MPQLTEEKSKINLLMFFLILFFISHPMIAKTIFGLRNMAIYTFSYYICPETAEMIPVAQICEGRNKNKEVTVHDGTHKGEPVAGGGRHTFVGGGRRPP